MSLNVKDPEGHRLAQAIAGETGESLTKVVIDSLRERHEKLEKRKRKARRPRYSRQTWLLS